jgi:hypothetical protein
MSGTIEFSENFEAGSNGATITTSNTGFSSIFGAGTAVFDTAHVADGSLSAKVTSTGAAGNYLGMQRTYGSSQSVVFMRVAIYLTALPTGNLYVCTAINAGTLPDIRINTTGTVTVRNNNVAVATTTNRVPIGSWFILEWKLDNGGSTQSVRIYSSLTGSPLETISGLYNQGTLTGMRVGITTTLAATIWMDDFADAFDDWVGPLPGIAFRAEAHVIGTGASPTTGSEPTGTVQGDVLVALFIVDSTASTTVGIPAGWTSLYTSVSPSNQFRQNLCYIVRGASAPSLAFTHSGNSSTYRELYILGFSGCSTSSPIDASANGGYTTGIALNPDPPAVTAVSNAAMAIAVGINRAGSSTCGSWVAPTGYTIRSDNTPANDGAIATKLLSVAGSENPSAFSGVASSGSQDAWQATVTLTPLSISLAVMISWFRA